jgi:hypothetical protein
MLASRFFMVIVYANTQEDERMTPAEYITLIETFLASNVGVTSIRHPDGRQINLDRKQAMAELSYWRQRSAAPASGSSVFGRNRFGLVGDA